MAEARGADPGPGAESSTGPTAAAGRGRLVYFSSSFVPSRLANSVHVMRMGRALAEHGLAVDLYALPGDEDADPYAFYGVPRSFRLVYLPWPRVAGRSLLAALAGALRARREGAALVFGRNLHGCYFAGVLGLPVAFEIHQPTEGLIALERWMLRRLVASPRFRGLVVISQPLKRHFVASLGLPEGRVLVAHDGADEPDAAVVPAPIGRPGRLQVGYVGQLYPGRGAELIEALARRCPWADFHLVGGSQRDIDHWRQRLQGLDNLVMHGFVPPAATDAYRKAFDVALAPYQETVSIRGIGNTASWMSPLKIFEYMAAGRAIVCSDLPVLREVLTHEENCLLCPPADVVAWAEALARLARDPALRVGLGQRARRGFLDRHSWRSRAARILAAVGPLAPVPHDV